VHLLSGERFAFKAKWYEIDTMLSERLNVSRERIQLYWNGCLLQDLHAMFTQPGMPSDVELSCVIAARPVVELEAELRKAEKEFWERSMFIREVKLMYSSKKVQLEKELAALQAEVMELRQQLAHCDRPTSPAADI
jgi:hypothetical protein